MKRLIILILMFIPHSAFALSEVGLSTNYRYSAIDDDNFQESISLTGSFSSYFGEMSAIELSYTSGESKLSVKPGDEITTITRTLFDLLGLDLVLTFADRKASFQPFIKMGGAYIKKEIYREHGTFGNDLIAELEGVVPSAGLGLRILFTERLSLKVGVDAWTSPLNQDEPMTIDYAGRVGISLFL